MHHPLSKLVCLGLFIVGCDSGEPAAESKATASAPASASASASAPAPAPASVAPAKQAAPAMTPEMMAERGKQLQEDREIAEAYKAGTLGDALAAEKMLLVDARAPADTDEARYFVFPGKLPAPADFAALTALKRSADHKPLESLYGGGDSQRVALFHGIEPGAYTVCAVLSGPADAAKLAYLKKAEEVYKASDKDGKLSGEKLQAAAERAKAETGYERKEIDWDSRPVRCNVAEVTADPSTRVVVVG